MTSIHMCSVYVNISIYEEVVNHGHAYVAIPSVHAKCLKEILLVVYFACQG